MQPDNDERAFGQGASVKTGEISLWAPAREEAFELSGLRRCQANLSPDSIVIESALAKAFQLDGTRVKSSEILLGKRPATAGDPRTLFEVPFVQFKNLAAPARGRASTRSEAANMNTVIVQPGDLALVGSCESSSIPGPPPSSKRTRLPWRASSTASTIPAAPAPTMQTSASSVVAGHLP